MTTLARNSGFEDVEDAGASVPMESNEEVWSEVLAPRHRLFFGGVPSDVVFQSGFSVPEIEGFQLIANNPHSVSTYGQVINSNLGVQALLSWNVGLAAISWSSQANTWLSDARLAAKEGNLRLAYHDVYRGLDMLMRNAEWLRVAMELQEISSGTYPLAFAIGAVRFVSSAAERIPNWAGVLRTLKQETERQGKDVKTALRGLIEVNGAE